ncbi:MAG: dihydroorotate dehydrogenase electron transfer subunit [Lachnospiraceae bacterium]|nr:dihydroorotate dehydrogenase electron transfer subunit [Lachnospiraceae bacterium]
MAKFKEIAKVEKQECIATGVYSMWIKTADIAKEAIAGQFISVYCKDGSKMLPRPISICEVKKEEGLLRIVYRVVGGGTKEMSAYVAGDDIDILGPLGNGFMQRDKKAILIGGGIGIPPMVELAKELKDKCEVSIVAGYRDELFLIDELKSHGEVYVATEDGSTGTKGTVIDAIKEQAVTGDVIYACGPTPMLRAIKEYALANDIEAQLSLEEKMACGIGACLACVCKSKDIDEHSQVHNKRICKDGPVFLAQEVEL